ncbi:transglutaminase-like domain-containing protein [Terriglobus tenax]|uniref:transglutaminase-like domain-containing protein n=1 Tax=Terriglobus tenax TaxID=1111115 RepID=UPI0021E00FCE|nr:transglutaminase family protein [Terriglobus tenax]
MLIRSEFDIQFQIPVPTTMVALLDLHPSVDPLAREVSHLVVEHIDSGSTSNIVTQKYIDSFGNRCTRINLPAGAVRLSGRNTVEMDGHPDPINTDARQYEVMELPSEVLQFLLASRYCEVDRLCGLAGDLFAHVPKGWALAVAIRDWVHSHVRFDYATARPTKTAMDVLTERVGVCRDFQHLAITLSRAMNIPARYVSGYLGDIAWPYSGAGDFSAWYEVFLDGRWWTMDARHAEPRVGRVLMSVGRDATDVALTTTFGVSNLTHFYVESNETDAEGNQVLPVGHPAAPVAA